MNLLAFYLVMICSLSFGQSIRDLKNGEKLLINYESWGCFSSDRDDIAFEMKNSKYYVLYGLVTKELTTDQVNSIKAFEEKLINIENHGCTTVDSYYFEYKNIGSKYSDASCSWNGWSVLLKELGLEKKKMSMD